MKRGDNKSMGYKDKKVAQEYINGYIREKYDRILVLFPSGRKEILKRVAAERGLSVNAFINSAIDEKLKRLKIEI